MEQFINWKGNAINKEKHGGYRATGFIYVLEGMANVAYVSNMLNIVTYLQNFMHMDIAKANTTVTNFVGFTCAFALLGGFLSDSYISRFKVLLIFAPFEFLGYGLLALQAYIPSLRPPTCNTSTEWSDCKHLDGSHAAILYIAMYSIALGEGFLRANLPSLGGDQFDDDDPTEAQQKSSFFNWFTLSLSVGAFTGLIFIVWVENNKGWGLGFALSAAAFLIGIFVFACGFRFYRHQIPTGSPLTRILQVLVAAFRNRKHQLPENPDDLNQESGKGLSDEVLLHSKGLKYLDKAAVFDGKNGSWFLCSVTQVEETKTVLRMIPVFLSATIIYIPIPQLLTLTVQQGGTMDTKVGALNVSPATLMVIPIALQMMILVLYDRFFVPFARKFTGIQTGITHLQRMGVGFIAASVATCIGAVIETKRKSVAKEHGLLDSGEHVPMSVMWLVIQFLAVSIIDAFTFVGMLEFFNSEASRGMKSLGTAIFWSVLGMASFLGSLLVDIVNKVTSHQGEVGWLAGNNLNRNHVDRFYWLLSFLGFIGFLNYLYWARRYTYRQHNLIQKLTY